MSQVIAYAEGSDGEIELRQDRLIIRRPGFWNMLKYGKDSMKEIPIISITGIDFRNANRLTFGTLHIEHGNEYSIKDRAQNTIKFSYRQREAFERLKEKIFALKNH